MEERQFLHRLCSLALSVDTSIEFAGIIDYDGKLLVGKSRNALHSNRNNARNNFHTRDLFSDDSERGLFKQTSLSSGYIGNIVSLQSSFIDKTSVFQLINLCNDLFLAYIPINEHHDKFLYVYFRSDKSLKNILCKLDSAF